MAMTAKILSAGQMAPEHSRAARSWLGWGQSDLARHANVSVNTVRNFESGQKKTTPNNLAAIRRAIESAGIRLLFDKSGQPAGIALEGAEVELS